MPADRTDTGYENQENGERMGNDILEGILKLVHTNLLILLLKYMTQVTEKCIHNAGVGGSSPPVATISLLIFAAFHRYIRWRYRVVFRLLLAV